MSAQDHGKKIIAAGENHTFAKMLAFEDAFKVVKKWVNVFKLYKMNKSVLCISYEELMINPVQMIEQIGDYLRINISKEEIETILKKYDRKNPNADMKGLHLNKAISKSYKDQLTQLEINQFKLELGSSIEQIGFVL